MGRRVGIATRRDAFAGAIDAEASDHRDLRFRWLHDLGSSREGRGIGAPGRLGASYAYRRSALCVLISSSLQADRRKRPRTDTTLRRRRLLYVRIARAGGTHVEGEAAAATRPRRLWIAIRRDLHRRIIGTARLCL